MSEVPRAGDWVVLAGVQSVEWLIGRRVFEPGTERAVCRCVPSDVVMAVEREQAIVDTARKLGVNGR